MSQMGCPTLLKSMLGWNTREVRREVLPVLVCVMGVYWVHYVLELVCDLEPYVLCIIHWCMFNILPEKWLRTCIPCRESMSWLAKRLPSKRGTLVSADLCQRIHNSLGIMEKALNQYRCVRLSCLRSCMKQLSIRSCASLFLNSESREVDLCGSTRWVSIILQRIHYRLTCVHCIHCSTWRGSCMIDLTLYVYLMLMSTRLGLMKCALPSMVVKTAQWC